MLSTQDVEHGLSFWNNEHGFGQLVLATVFSEDETASSDNPIADDEPEWMTTPAPLHPGRREADPMQMPPVQPSGSSPDGSRPLTLATCDVETEPFDSTGVACRLRLSSAWAAFAQTGVPLALA